MSTEELLALLKKYMQHVLDMEGSTFVRMADFALFTPEQLALLRKIDAEIGK